MLPYVWKAFGLCTCCVVALSSCESDGNEGGGNAPYTERLVSEITGVEYYDGYENKPYRRHAREQFFYDDEKRLDRWISTREWGGHDYQFFYESEDHISIFGDRWTDASAREAVVAEIDLNAAGLAESVDLGDDYTYAFRYAGGRLSQRIDPRGYTTTYTWKNGDLTAIGVFPNPYPSQSGDYLETCRYSDEPMRTNLDLNHLAYGTEYYSIFVNRIGAMLGIAGFFGRNAHYVAGNYLDPDADGVRVDIRWKFDADGYPTGWTADYWDLGASEKDSGWEYTIRYEN